MAAAGYARADDEWLPEEEKMREMWLADIGWRLNDRERILGWYAENIPETEAKLAALAAVELRPDLDQPPHGADVAPDDLADQADDVGTAGATARFDRLDHRQIESNDTANLFFVEDADHRPLLLSSCA